MVIEVTSERLAAIADFIKRTLTWEHQVDFTVSADVHHILVDVSTAVDTVSLYGERPQILLVRAVSWLGVYTAIPGIGRNSVVIDTNNEPCPPSAQEMALANAINVNLRVANKGFGTPPGCPVRPTIELTPDQKRFQLRMSGL